MWDISLFTRHQVLRSIQNNYVQTWSTQSEQAVSTASPLFSSLISNVHYLPDTMLKPHAQSGKQIVQGCKPGYDRAMQGAWCGWGCCSRALLWWAFVGTMQRQCLAHSAKVRRGLLWGSAVESRRMTVPLPREVLCYGAENEDWAEQVQRPIKKYTLRLKLCFFFSVWLP